MSEKDKLFAPSYAVATLPAYEQEVDVCAPWEHILSWNERVEMGAPPECKRVFHRMMQGGRRALRYPDAGWSGGSDPGTFPPDPKHGGPKAKRRGRPPLGTLPQTLPGDRDGSPEGLTTQTRLGGLNPHYHARTQPFVEGRFLLVELLPEVRTYVGQTGISLTLKGIKSAQETKEADVTTAISAIAHVGNETVSINTFNRRPVDIGDFRITFYVTGNRVVARVSHSSQARKIQVVRDAIGRYMEMQNTPGEFIIPSSSEPLVRAGMPKAIAHMLVQRVRPLHGSYKSYLARPKSAEMLDLLNLLESEMGKTEIGFFERPKKIRGTADEVFQGIVVNKVWLLTTVEFNYVKRDGEEEFETLLAVVPSPPFQDTHVQLTALDIARAHEDFVAAVKGTGRKFQAESDNPEFLRALLSDGVRLGIEELRRENKLSPTSRIEISFQGVRDSKETFSLQAPVPLGEHSNLRIVAPREEAIRYKNLSNVPLEELPSLLVRLAARKERIGRRLPLLESSVKQNPRAHYNNGQLAVSAGSSPVVPKTSLSEVTLQFVFDKLYSNPDGPQLVPVLDSQGNPKPDRVYWPETKYRSFREASGVSIKRRVPVSLKEVDVAQARSWMKIASVGKAMRKSMSEIATAEMSTLTPPSSLPEPARRPVKGASSSPTATKPAETRKNPMNDDDFWLYQYSKSPYGAERDLPAARRNPEELMFEEDEEEVLDNPRKKGRGKKSHARKGRASSTALVRRPPAAPARRPAARRPARAAALPAADDSAAVRQWVGKRTQQILRSHGCSLKQAMKQAWMEVKGKAKGRSRSRSNPWYDSLYLPDTTVVGPSLVRSTYDWQDGTMVMSDLVPGPYTKTNPSELEASPEPAMWEYHPVYDQTVGQFSTGESFTRGIQPMNRRNPAMTARFPSTCAHCGEAIERGHQIKDSGKRGPRNGKLMAHVNCGR